MQERKQYLIKIQYNVKKHWWSSKLIKQEDNYIGYARATDRANTYDFVGEKYILYIWFFLNGKLASIETSRRLSDSWIVNKITSESLYFYDQKGRKCQVYLYTFPEMELIKN